MRSSKDTIATIEDLKEKNLIKENNFHKAFLEYLIEEADEDNSNIGIVLGEDEEIIDIGKYKDADKENITRYKGGLIQATINKRPKFANFNHLIMPVKNEFGNCRFYYRGFLKKSLMENILNRQKKNDF